MTSWWRHRLCARTCTCHSLCLHPHKPAPSWLSLVVVRASYAWSHFPTDWEDPSIEAGERVGWFCTFLSYAIGSLGCQVSDAGVVDVVNTPVVFRASQIAHLAENWLIIWVTLNLAGKYHYCECDLRCGSRHCKKISQMRSRCVFSVCVLRRSRKDVFLCLMYNSSCGTLATKNCVHDCTLINFIFKK